MKVYGKDLKLNFVINFCDRDTNCRIYKRFIEIVKSCSSRPKRRKTIQNTESKTCTNQYILQFK